MAEDINNPPKLWKAFLRTPDPNGGYKRLYAVVFADNKTQAKEIIRVLLKPDIKIDKVTLTTTYPLVLIGGDNITEEEVS